MKRRVWIIKKKSPVTEEVRQQALAHDCQEVARGIPPALKELVKEADLPCAYEEAESPAPVQVASLGDLVNLINSQSDLINEQSNAITALQSRVAELERKAEPL